MSRPSPYPAAILGLGFIGGADPESGAALGQRLEGLDGTHTQALLGNPRVALVAGASRDEGRRARFAARTRARTYEDWQTLLETERPVIVSVATRTPEHAPAVTACLEAGVKVIWCEKPIARTLGEAEAMIQLAREKTALLVINHQRRFNPNFQLLSNRVLAGDLGELTSCSVRWPTGRLGNVGTHFLDAIQMLTGRSITAVSGTLDTSGRQDCRGADFRDPGGWGWLRLRKNLHVSVDAADAAKGPARIILHGTLGRAVAFGDGRVRWETMTDSEEMWPAPPRQPSSMDRALQSMIAWLDHAVPFPVPPEESLRCLEAIIAFHVSHDQNAAWVRLPLRGPDRERALLSG